MRPQKAGGRSWLPKKVFPALLIALHQMKRASKQLATNAAFVQALKARVKNQCGYWNINKQALRTATKIVGRTLQKHLRAPI
jgi:hypothetical protein